MTNKGKSPIEQAVNMAFKLKMIDDWVFEIQRDEVEQNRSIIESIQPTRGWSIFVHCTSIDYAILPSDEYPGIEVGHNDRI